MDLDADFDAVKAAGVAILIGTFAAFLLWGWNSTIGKRLVYFGPAAGA